jgi:hypothetical protein
MIYFIKSKKFVKIGVSSDPNSRLKELQTGNPFKLKIAATIPGHFATEKELHNIFERFRMEGEWFRYDAHLRACIDACNDEGRKHKTVASVRELLENGYHRQVRQKANRNSNFRVELNKFRKS